MPTPKKKPSSPRNAYLKYSTIAFEMVAAILLCAGLGYWLEGVFGVKRPFLLLPFLLLGLFVSMYNLFRRLSVEEGSTYKKGKDEKPPTHSQDPS